MADPVIGGNLIHVVEIDQDQCQQDYGVTCAARLSDATRLNLLEYTAQFDNAYWTPINATVTANQGTSPQWQNTTADEVLETVTIGAHGIDSGIFNTTTATINVSLYIEGISRTDLRVQIGNNTFGNFSTVLDVETDTLTATAGPSASNAVITAVNNGWRISVDMDVTAPASWNLGDDFFVRVLFKDAGGLLTYAGDVTKGWYLWGAQVTEGSGVQTYQEITDGTVTATSDDAGRSGEKCFNTRATCQDPDNYTPETLTIKCARAASNLPRDEYIFPNLKSISTQPSRLNTNSRSRNEPLGQRASMTATFEDHPNTDRFVDVYADERISGAARADGIGYDPLERGFFWSKWRARNLYYLGRPIRALQGVVDPVDLSQLTTRNYVIESVEGPDRNGLFKITGKDPLKLADNDRAQAPIASQGEIGNAGGISDTDTSITLEPAGIGDSEYPASGKVAVGREIMSFTRSSDTLTVTRAQNNTEASAHDEGDAVQLVLEYSGANVDTIVYDLLVNYAGVDASFIDTNQWLFERQQFMPFGYSAVIPKPVGVKTLIGELAEQAGFSIWWDEINQTIPMAAVKQPGAGAITLTDDDIIEGSFKVKDRPDARISQVWVNYGQIDPTESLDNDNNYRNTLVSVDAEAGQAAQYGQDVIRKVNSRWIVGQATASNLTSRLLSRFRDIIREYQFSLPSYRADEIRMGDVHRISTVYQNDPYGQAASVPIRIMAVEQAGDVLRVEAEELRFKFDPDEINNTRYVYISNDQNDVNLRTAHDLEYPGSPPIAATDIIFVVNPNVVVGASSTSARALDVGSWGDYTYNSLTLQVATGARITGAGGKGGGNNDFPDGLDGGTAVYTRVNIDVENNGTIAGGGGGGGAGAFYSGISTQVYGGGGGAGRVAGAGGVQSPTFGGGDGTAGTLTTGGTGASGSGVSGGNGGAPGQAGQNGTDNATGQPDGQGGAAGYAIDGASYVTLTGNAVTGPTTG